MHKIWGIITVTVVVLGYKLVLCRVFESLGYRIIGVADVGVCSESSMYLLGFAGKTNKRFFLL